MKHTRRNIGTVSHGTLKSGDLIDSFIYELRQQKPLAREHRKLIREIETRIKAGARAERQGADSYFDTDSASEDVAELSDALNAYAPIGFYFGSHPGDGSDFGFWLDDCFVEDFDGLRVSDLSEIPCGFIGEVLHVNDHGNVSLYAKSRSHLRELWSIV